MTEAAYFWSKDAEIILAPYVQVLVGAEKPPQISSPLLPECWDYAFDDLFVDLKLAMKANIYGKISDQTLADIRASLRNGVLVAVLVPPYIYLLSPWDIGWDGSLEALWNMPSVPVPKEVLEQVWDVYVKMTS